MSERSATDLARRRTRLFLFLALAVATTAFVVIAAGGINRNLVYYWTPSDLRAAGDKAYGATIRLGGMVVAGSIRRPAGVSGIQFQVKDSTAMVPVKSSGVPPQLFREGIGVVVEGTMRRDGNFEANRLMVSHSNEYQAPKEGHALDRKELERLMSTTEGLKAK